MNPIKGPKFTTHVRPDRSQFIDFQDPINVGASRAKDLAAKNAVAPVADNTPPRPQVQSEPTAPDSNSTVDSLTSVGKGISSFSDILGPLLVGATPVLVGHLIGDTAGGYKAGSQGLLDLNKNEMELEKARLRAYRGTAGSGGKPLTTSNVLQTVGEDGEPVYTRVEDAVGQKVPKKTPSAGLSLQERMDLEAHKAKLRENLKKVPQTFKNEKDLRHDYSQDPITKETKARLSSWTSIDRIAKSPQTGANDISLIFAYMKMIDPESVVREGEQATARNAGAIPDNIRNLYNRMVRGEDVLLPRKTRANFITEASNLYKAQLTLQGQVDADYRRMAQQYGLSPDNVLVLPAATSQPSAPAASAGKVLIDLDGDIVEIPASKEKDFIKEYGGKRVN